MNFIYNIYTFIQNMSETFTMRKDKDIPKEDIYKWFIADHLGLKTLGDLDHLTNLKILSIISSQLTVLPKLPDGLEELNITSNPIKELILPSNIKRLYMTDTFDEIPELPITLEILEIGDFDKIGSLKHLTNLQDLYITNIKTKIPELPPNLNYLRIEDVDIKYLPDEMNCCYTISNHINGCRDFHYDDIDKYYR